MRKKDLPIEFSDGTTNLIQLYLPATTRPRAVVAIFPAMGVRAAFYEHMAKAFTKVHIAAALVDHRGHGNSNIRPMRGINFGFQEIITIDYYETIQKIRETLPGVPLFLAGHSLGGKIGSLFAARYPELIDGLVLLTACSVYYKAWKGWERWKIRLGIETINVIARILGYYPGDKVGFGGREFAGVIADWSRQCRTGKYLVTNQDFAYDDALADTQFPVLAISVAGDELAPFPAVRHLLSKFRNNPHVRHIHLEKDDPRNPGYDHFNFAKNPEAMVQIISEWIDEVSASDQRALKFSDTGK